jgi:hypothetical protein|tara:strand:- start:317 stop:466 length:150 start_codon:yes stop_codon:yes gene_type:complete
MSGDVYYRGNCQWTDDYSKREVYSSNPSAMLVNTDGKNGGFNGASVVSE